MGSVREFEIGQLHYLGGHRELPRRVSREPEDPRGEGGRGGRQGGDGQEDDRQGTPVPHGECLREPRGRAQADPRPLQVLLPQGRHWRPDTWREELGRGL